MTLGGVDMRDDEIRAALERNVKAVTLRAGVGKGTARTVARLKPHLECEVTEGPYSFTVGMTEKYGGNAAGPNPGVFGRGAVASCLAMGYAMWAARMGVPIDSLEVEIQSDYDVRGELGVDESIPPGSLALRAVVTVESPAPEEDVRRVIDQCDRTSSWLDNMERAIPVERQLRVSSTHQV
jgi:uncharacterized OsmC-like protein